MTIEWKDESSYSYEEGRRKGEVEPSVLATQLGSLRLVVHRHIHYKDKWLMSCNQLKLGNFVLKADKIEEAKKEALEFLDGYLQARISELQSIRDSIALNRTL